MNFVAGHDPVTELNGCKECKSEDGQEEPELEMVNWDQLERDVFTSRKRDNSRFKVSSEQSYMGRFSLVQTEVFAASSPHFDPHLSLRKALSWFYWIHGLVRSFKLKVVFFKQSTVMQFKKSFLSDNFESYGGMMAGPFFSLCRKRYKLQ